MTIVVPTRSTYRNDVYAPGEDDYIVGPVSSWAGENPHGVIFCHAAGGTADAVMKNTNQLTLLRVMGGWGATVHCGDLGGTPFGNDAVGLPSMEAAAAELDSWGVGPEKVLVGISQGFVMAAVYALNHPENVKAIAGIVPGIDLADLRTRDPLLTTMIDAAYPPTYNDAVDGPRHSPIRFADELDPDLPIHLWGSSNDPFVTPASVQAFIAARPQTEFTDIGPAGHSLGGATLAIAAWVEQFTT